MSLLQHFDTLVEIDPTVIARHASSADLAAWVAALTPAQQAELFTLLARHAQAQATPWRPKTMQAWLT